MKERNWAIVLGIIIGVLLIGSLSTYLWIQHSANQKEGICIAKIYQNGELLEEINLSEVKEPYQKKIKASNGYNTIEVHKGEIGVVSADCPDQLCKKQGFTSRSSKPIVCLPHRFSIEISNQEEEEAWDAVSE